MKNFNVLDRKTNILKSYVLEASAGTGKTFSIENIVTRLIVEGGFDINQILVVTFTKKAAQELKTRIHENIRNSINNITYNRELPDYLQSVVQTEPTQNIIRLLQRALLNFDEAPIYTIHKFCLRSLKEHSSSIIFQDMELDSCNQQTLINIVKDYLRCGISDSQFSIAQISLLIKELGPVDKLIDKLLKNISKHGNFTETEDYQAVEAKIISMLHSIKKMLPMETIEDEWRAILNNQPKKLAAKYKAQEKSFYDFILSEQLDDIIINGIDFIDTLILPETSAWSIVKNELIPLLKEVRNINAIFLKMVSACQQRIEKTVSDRGLMLPDMILKQMEGRLKQTSFISKIQRQYSAVIIDEFQDTDPVQWNIFSQLFVNNRQLLYLVGDPKQSIYAFRNADIYTYLQAAKELGQNNMASLDVNYRSQQGLVHGLNDLFNGLCFNLPRHNDRLRYTPVKAYHEHDNINDQKASVHFFLSEDSCGRSKNWPTERSKSSIIFPYVANEIISLHNNHNINYSSFAILVSDRYEAEKLQLFLQELNIPCCTRHNQNITETPILQAMFDLLYAIQNPKNRNYAKQFLAGYWLKLSHKEILLFDEGKYLTEVIEQLYTLHSKESITSLWEAFLGTTWFFDKKTILEKIMENKNGIKELKLIEEIIAILEAQLKQPFQIEAAINILQKIEENPELYPINIAQEEENVEIMTMHISKGLEYEIIFALGVANRNKNEDNLTPYYDRGKVNWIPFGSDDNADNLQQTELDAEKLRQLYVALTRAKKRLYIPSVFDKDKKEISSGKASPIELFWQQFMPDINLQNICQHLTKLNSKNISYEIISNDIDIIANNLDDSTIKLDPITIKRDHTTSLKNPMASFSSLTKSYSSAKSLYNPPHDFDSEIKNQHTLPAGSETGMILHNILEKISFPLTCDEQLHKLISHYTVNTKFAQWNDVIFAMLSKTLQSKIITEKSSFCLKNLNMSDIIRETEFLHRSNNVNMIGFVDMIFRYRGLYYILDWKSNWLGPDDSHYGNFEMKKAMQEHQYYLQAQIYQEAFQKYLQIILGDHSENLFGGVIYCFLRGSNSASAGILYFTHNDLMKRNNR